MPEILADVSHKHFRAHNQYNLVGPNLASQNLLACFHLSFLSGIVCSKR
jgi:hypothetical protein